MKREDMDPMGSDLLDPLGYERLVRRIMDAAAPELARRARAVGPLDLLTGWARPTLAAAAVIAVIAGGALALTDRPDPRSPAGAVVDVGVPGTGADWMEDGREPTPADLVLAMERRR